MQDWFKILVIFMTIDFNPSANQRASQIVDRRFGRVAFARRIKLEACLAEPQMEERIPDDVAEVFKKIKCIPACVEAAFEVSTAKLGRSPARLSSILDNT